MSKSTLSISYTTNAGNYSNETRTIEVPCRLPDSFNFKFGGRTLTAEISDSSKAGFANSYVYRVEHDGETPPSAEEFTKAYAHATAILATIKAALGITGPVPPGSPMPAIALAYEAECAAYEASLKAFNALPVALVQVGLCGSAPDSEGPTGIRSPACRMLAKYVEHVFENAAAQVLP